MYEPHNIITSLNIFNYIYNNITKYLDFSLVDSNHLHGKIDNYYIYSEKQLENFNNIILDKKYFEL
jgi:hypothetical protein